MPCIIKIFHRVLDYASVACRQFLKLPKSAPYSFQFCHLSFQSLMPSQTSRKCTVCSAFIFTSQKTLACNSCGSLIHTQCYTPLLKAKKSVKAPKDYTCDSCCNNFIFPFASVTDEELSKQLQINDKSDNFVSVNACTLNSLFSNFLPINPDSTCDENDETTLFPFNDDTDYIDTENAGIFLQTDTASPNFSALSLNIRPINNYKNFAKLESLLASLKFSPTIIAVSETWLRQHHSCYQPVLPGYTYVSNSRSKHRGGGVGFFVQGGLKFSIRSDSTIMLEKVFESLFIDVQFGNKTFTCGTIYRSPNSNLDSHSSFMNTLTSTLKQVNQSANCFLFGDLIIIYLMLMII